MSQADLLKETERYLHDQIPLTRAMGVTVESFDADGFTLAAPLEANHNHLGTAFGGSLSALATLAGYGLLWLKLGDRSAHIVVRSSRIRYRHPVRQSIRAIARPPSAQVLETFLTKFQSTGKAAIRLQVEVIENDRVCVEFDGLFVALK
jgi:thioesterase domain-containing protein